MQSQQFTHFPLTADSAGMTQARIWFRSDGGEIRRGCPYSLAPMVFSSSVFIFYFLPAVLGLYFLALRLGGRTSAHVLLTLASYFFYGWSNPAFILLMLFSTAIDYICGLVISRRAKGARIALTISILTNLGLLGFFKYFNFGMESWNFLMDGMGFEAASYQNFLRITLPLGISFYTFQSMSYSIDVYRGEAQAIRNPLDFACYVSMFPQLVAGPIIRFQEVAEQLLERQHTAAKFARGVAFFMLGMSKKVLLADPCGKVADECFAAADLHALEAWAGIVAYAFQIYFDFSAYSDMAIGLGLMFGFVFPKNFASPYRACTITEFWQRWHLSLSTWLRDYLYIPLGGNRMGAGRTYVNLALVMLLGRTLAWRCLEFCNLGRYSRRDAGARAPDGQEGALRPPCHGPSR